MEKVKEKLKVLKTNQAIISGGLTSVLQPLDVVINKPFKDRLRQKWVELMLSDDKPFTSRFSSYFRQKKDLLHKSVLSKSTPQIE